MSKSNMMLLQCKNDFICCKNVKVLKCLLGWQNVFVACTWQRGVSDAACTVSVSEYVKWAPIIYVLWLVMESYFQTDGNNRQFNYIRSFSFLFWFLQKFSFLFYLIWLGKKIYSLCIWYSALQRKPSFCPISWQHDG